MRLPAILLLGCAAALGLAMPASAQPHVGGTLNCSPATLSGTYGYAVSGFSGTTPVANYGFFTSDGVSHFTGTATVSVGGAIGSANFTATYTLGSNRTGAAVFASGDVVTHLAMTVNANGGLIDFVQTDAGATASGTAQPLAPSCEVSAFSGPCTYAVNGWVYVEGVPVPYADAGRIVADGNGNFTGNMYRGQNTCSNGTLSGEYVYSVNGFGVAPGVLVPAAYSGMVTANGNGTLQGSDYISDVDGDGITQPRTYTATYTVNSDCSGSEVVKDSLGETADLDFFVADQGSRVEFIQTDAGLVISGEAQPLPGGTCSDATLSGSYGYAAAGWLIPPLVPSLTGEAGAGQYTAVGAGHFSGVETVSVGGTLYGENITGTYQVNSNCTGSSVLQDSQGNTFHFQFVVSPNGQQINSIETDSDFVVADYAQYQFAQASASIVNLGSYATNVAPGGLITIFGSGFTNGSTQQANGAPWPLQLDGVTVQVNRAPIPLYYVSSVQIDAQFPVNISSGPAQLVVEAGTQSTAPATFTVSAAAPGILICGPLRAVAQDFTTSASGVLVGPAGVYSEPASPGDELVVYLVDGGAVNVTSGSWSTGAASPGSFSVSAPYTVTIGGVAECPAPAR